MPDHTAARGQQAPLLPNLILSLAANNPKADIAWSRDRRGEWRLETAYRAPGALADGLKITAAGWEFGIDTATATWSGGCPEFDLAIDELRTLLAAPAADQRSWFDARCDLADAQAELDDAADNAGEQL